MYLSRKYFFVFPQSLLCVQAEVKQRDSEVCIAISESDRRKNKKGLLEFLKDLFSE